MMPHDIQQLERLIENGLIKLEITGGIPTWEALPTSRHQKAAKRIEDSIQPLPGSSCGCYTLADTYISFPDGSLKRPDIAIFCDEPPDSDEALDVLPPAVIEVLSLGYEDKDLGPDGAPFYLACGVRDVLIVDPRSERILHYQQGQSGPVTLKAPATIELQCGCHVRLT